MNKNNKFLTIIVLVGIIIVIIGLIIRMSYGEELALLLTPISLAVLVFASMYFQGIPIDIESSFGQSVKKVPHFVSEDGKRRSIPKEWRLNLLDNVLDKKRDKIRAICGECNNIDSIRYALERGFPVELICGPSVKDKITRSNIKNLLEKYPNIFSVYILDKRPKNHSTLLGNNILLESIHRYDVEYDKAVLIENANEHHVTHFISQFELKKPKSKATIPDLEKLGLYSEEEITGDS
ncbi:MAG: hypothetical protein JW999_00280 [Methanotrichaceae archaeon]|nr:hypothetical protein [Methanotrichaceae archaeon]